MSLHRILLVFAHPDDESFTSGVTITKYANRPDTEVILLCATRGQAGKPGNPPLCTQEELPAMREQELREACEFLGITQLDLLDYMDGKLDSVPLQELTAHIVKAIEKYTPEIVITFAPHGISGHQDHRVISRATSVAVTSQENSSVKKLYHCTLPSVEPFVGVKNIFTDSPEVITTAIKGEDYVDHAAKALLAHRTQHMSVDRVFPGIRQGDYSHVRSINHFILVWHNIPNYTIQEKEDDLFAGLL